MAAALRVVLGHGASGTAASMRPHVEGLLKRGIPAEAIDLPKGRAERAMPVLARRIEADPASFVIGGASPIGGGGAALVAGEGGAGGAGLPCPPHPPPHPQAPRAAERPPRPRP